jgi:7-cyano-7-deazaguanine synthase
MPGNAKKKAVSLLSGGLDSAVTSAIACSRGFEVHALSVSYGQRHAVELESAKRICRSLGVASHKVVEVDLRLFGGSALTDDIGVPKGSGPVEPGEIPPTYVPARNTIFLSLALAFSEALGARDIFIGVSSVDYSGYPDCRPAFIEAFEGVANLGTRAADSDERYVIHSPLVKLSKAETIRVGYKLGVDFGLTWTCYDPEADDIPCSSCESCRLRAKGFLEAGISDPLIGGRG